MGVFPRAVGGVFHKSAGDWKVQDRLELAAQFSIRSDGMTDAAAAFMQLRGVVRTTPIAGSSCRRVVRSGRGVVGPGLRFGTNAYRFGVNPTRFSGFGSAICGFSRW